MKLTSKIGAFFSTLGISLVGVAAASLNGSGPSFLQSVVPPKYAGGVIFGVSVLQAAVSRYAFQVNPNGSPASLPYLPNTNGFKQWQ